MPGDGRKEEVEAWVRPLLGSQYGLGHAWKGQSQELGFLVLVPMGRPQGEEGIGVEMPLLLSARWEHGLLRLPRGTGNPWAGRAALMSPSARGLGVPCPAVGNQTFTKPTQLFSVLRAVTESLSAGPAPHHGPGWATRLT